MSHVIIVYITLPYVCDMCDVWYVCDRIILNRSPGVYFLAPASPAFIHERLLFETGV